MRHEFEVLYMKDSETVDRYFQRTLEIANKTTAQGENLAQTTIIEKGLRSMTIEFNYVVCSMEESNDFTTLSIDELHSSFLIHKQKYED